MFKILEKDLLTKIKKVMHLPNKKPHLICRLQICQNFWKIHGKQS
jgi:hypothetical protein